MFEDEVEQAVKASMAELKAEPTAAAAAASATTDAAGAAAATAAAAAEGAATGEKIADKIEPTEEEKTLAKPRDGEDEAARVARLAAEGRESNGRFKKKDDGAAASSAATGAKDGDKPLAPPTHWPPEAKAEFQAAPKAVQQAILKREGEMEKARGDWQGKAEEYNRIDKIIAGKRNDWAAAGITADVAIGRLLAFENILKTDPIDGVVRVLKGFAAGKEMSVVEAIAKANGYTLTKGNQAGSDKGGNPPPAQDEATARELTALRTKIADMERKETERTTSAQNAAAEAIVAEIKAVENDPKNIYYANLKPQIQALVRAQEAKGDTRPVKVIVQEAYDNAVWADPVTRDLVMKARQRDEAETARKAEADRVAAAKKAAVSISGGAPGDGQSQQVRSPNSNSIEDDVRAARAQLATSRA